MDEIGEIYKKDPSAVYEGSIPLKAPEKLNREKLTYEGTIALSKVKECYHGEVSRFLKYAEANGGVSMDIIQPYIAYMRDVKEYSTATINKNIMAIKAMIRGMFDSPSLTELQKFTMEQSLKDVKQIKHPNKGETVKTLTSDQINKLINEAPERKALIIEFLYQTGSRVSEMCGALLSKCAEGPGHIEIEIIGKGNKSRRVRISEILFHRIKEEYRGQKYLFETERRITKKGEHRGGLPLDPRNVAKEIKRLGLSILNIDKVTPHMFRHSFATHKIRQTGKIQAVSEYLGHSSTAITLDLYTHEKLDDGELF